MMRFACILGAISLLSACGQRSASQVDSAMPPDVVDLGAAVDASSDQAVPGDLGAAPSPGACVGWCWELPTPTGDGIESLSSVNGRVWAASPRAVLHWDGSTWSSVVMPAGIGLYAIVAVADDDVWAVGAADGAPTVGATMHWDGSAWKRVANPSSGVLTAVSASGSSDVWAVDGSEVIHWNGQAWATAPAPAQSFGMLQAAWSSSATDVWVGTSNGIIHFDGNSWSGGWSPVAASIGSFSGKSPSDIWALAGGTTLLHWDGSAWTTKGTLPAPLNATSLWEDTSADVWLSGIARWNGSSLVLNGTSGPDTTDGRVSGSSASDVWLGGSALWHLTGGKWTTVTRRDGSIALRRLSGNLLGKLGVGQTGTGDGLLVAQTGTPRRWARVATGVRAAINDARTNTYAFPVWLVGDNGLIEMVDWSSGAASPETTFPSGTTANLRGIFLTNKPAGIGVTTPVRFIVGDNGTALSWDETSGAFVAESTMTTANLRAIDGYSPNDPIWAVGDGPTMLSRTVTTGWSAVTLPTTMATTLGAVAAAASNDAWAAGDAGTILHYTGTWQVTPSGTSADITALAAPASGVAFAVTSLGELLSWNGSSWQLLRAGDGVALVGVTAASASDVTIARADGTMWNWNGSVFVPLPLEYPAGFRQTWARSANDVWAVGDFADLATPPTPTATGYAFHFDGSSWQLVSDGAFGEIAGVSGSVTNTWLVAQGVIARWNGAAFTPVFAAAGDAFTAVWAADDSHAWAVGSGDGMVTWNGTTWTATPILDSSNKPIAFVDVKGSAADDVWAISASSLYHWDGAAWAQKSEPAPAMHVWSEQRGIVWLTAAKQLYRGDGPTWTMHEPAASTYYNSVSVYFEDVAGRSATDVWAIGVDGVAYHFDGTTWVAVSTGAGYLGGGTNDGSITARLSGGATEPRVATGQGLLVYRP